MAERGQEPALTKGLRWLLSVTPAAPASRSYKTSPSRCPLARSWPSWGSPAEVRGGPFTCRQGPAETMPPL